jgi:2-octaprenyl-6-methoxyphenol hydroxylase
MTRATATPTSKDRARADVLIAGGNLAGLTLAIALRRALGPQFAVVVADPAFGRPSRDARASAIAASARRLLETLGAWHLVADEAQPILDMVITDSAPGEAVRPTFLTFDGEVGPGEPFAHMVENKTLIDALVSVANETGVQLHAAAIDDFTTESDSVTAGLAGGREIRARLLVGADGARSAIRDRAGIVNVGWSYGQSAIVTTVAHERDHHGRAEEHFFPAGPFAILPLKGRRSSIVWTEEGAEAERIVSLTDADFHTALEQRFGLHLGEISVAGPRRTFPLGLWMARSFIAERVALVGDAAHVIHPIAGQGLNMGLRDVAALAEVIADAARLGLDIGGATVLERYQRWRRFDTMAMAVATDGLNRLFSNRSDVLRLLRDAGLGVVDRMLPVKNFLIREAAGLSGDIPKLLRGEML